MYSNPDAHEAEPCRGCPHCPACTARVRTEGAYCRGCRLQAAFLGIEPEELRHQSGQVLEIRALRRRLITPARFYTPKEVNESKEIGRAHV